MSSRTVNHPKLLGKFAEMVKGFGLRLLDKAEPRGLDLVRDRTLWGKKKKLLLMHVGKRRQNFYLDRVNESFGTGLMQPKTPKVKKNPGSCGGVKEDELASTKPGVLRGRGHGLFSGRGRGTKQKEQGVEGGDGVDQRGSVPEGVKDAK